MISCLWEVTMAFLFSAVHYTSYTACNNRPYEGKECEPWHQPNNIQERPGPQLWVHPNNSRVYITTTEESLSKTEVEHGWRFLLRSQNELGVKSAFREFALLLKKTAPNLNLCFFAWACLEISRGSACMLGKTPQQNEIWQRSKRLRASTLHNYDMLWCWMLSRNISCEVRDGGACGRSCTLIDPTEHRSYLWHDCDGSWQALTTILDDILELTLTSAQ